MISSQSQDLKLGPAPIVGGRGVSRFHLLGHSIAGCC